MKFLNRLRNFMYGRYGIDEFYSFLIKIYFIILILNLFLGSRILNLITLILAFIIFGRVFSKNIYKRNKENMIFLKYKKKFKKIFSKRKKHRDRDHVYKKCYKCGTILKLPLPKKRGFKTAVCPECGRDVKFLTLKKRKVIVFKNKKK